MKLLRFERTLAGGATKVGMDEKTARKYRELGESAEPTHPPLQRPQRLLFAKTELWLEKELKRLDRFAALIVDGLGYAQQSREEMEVLFTLLAHNTNGTACC